MKKLIVSLCLFASAAFADTAEIVFFRGIMLPFNEVPAVNLQAGAPTTLICHIVRDQLGGKLLSASIDFVVGYGFPGPVSFTGLHIHSGAAGVNGPIVIRTSLGSPAPVPSDPSGFGLINLQGQILPTDQTGLDALNGMLENADQYYVNLHTTAFPGGVVRAQLNRATFVVPMLLMTPAKMVPAIPSNVASAASQLVVLTAFDRNGSLTSTQLIFDVNYNLGRQTTITGLHLHRGAAGISGPITINSGLGQGFFPPVATDATGSGTFRQFAEVDMSDPAAVATVEAMIANPKDYYMDIHTTEFPAGLARDQVQGSDLIRQRITMTPPGEIAATPSASAPTLLLLRTLRAEDGTVLVGSIMWICNYRFPGKTDFTGLDIYDGIQGVTGPRRLGSTVSLTQPYPTETGFGNMFFFTTISDATGVATVKSITENPERHYIEIRTGANQAVAVRTQLGPVITALPVVTSAGNSANGTAPAQGGLISIYGTNLSKNTSDPYDSRPLYTPGLTGWFGKTLPTSYNGTSVTIGGRNAPIAYVSPTQINAQVPLELPAGPHPIVVTNTNGAGTAANVTIAATAPAVFTNPAAPGSGIVVHQNFSLVTPQHPAKAGEVLILYATGLGQTTPPLTTGTLLIYPPRSDTATASVAIGGREAPVIYSLASPNAAGLYQVAVTMPAGVPAGTAPVVLRIGAAAAASVNIDVQ